MTLPKALAEEKSMQGDWATRLDPPGLPLVMHLHEKEKEGWQGNFDSPGQNAFGLPFDEVTAAKDSVAAKFSKGQIEITVHYEREADVLVGTFAQAGKSMVVTFTRTTKTLSRPQEPKPPFDYVVEDMSFKNKNGTALSGTLTSPKGDGPFPAVILICGSGPNTRDEPVFGHKPFLLLADWFTRHGIAVLRYDKRGTGKSDGDFAAAAIPDFADDACAAVDFMLANKRINAKKIGLLGHSEGGIVAPMVVTRGEPVAFVILLAGTVVNGYDILKYQYSQQPEAQKYPEILEMAKNAKSQEELKEDSIKLIKEKGESDAVLAIAVKQLSSPWFYDFVHYDPSGALASVKCPVLALFGEKDQQVPVSLNVPAIQKVIESQNNSPIQVVVIPNANHLFQNCKTGKPSEYAEIEETMQPKVLEILIEFIRDQAK